MVVLAPLTVMRLPHGHVGMTSHGGPSPSITGRLVSAVAIISRSRLRMPLGTAGIADAVLYAVVRSRLDLSITL